MPSTNSVGVEIPTGLVQFPITKILMICCVGVALTASLFNMKYLFLLQYDPFIVEYGQYWRYFTFQLGSLNESDVAIMTLIWYQFRSLERLFGSRKYLNIVILSWAYTTVVIFLISNLLNKLLPGIWWDQYTNGPLPVILCLTHFYKQYTPRLYEFNIIINQPFLLHSNTIVWKLTDQFFIHGLLFLAMVNQGATGLVIGLISWICAILMDNGLLPGTDSFQLAPFKDSWNRSSSTLNRPSAVMTNDMTSEDLNEEEAEEPQDEPQRTLGVQFLDTFRR
ncbi:Dsc2p [Kluyveromyces lactis]|uniref:KLLA0C04532p n=1 Tax=Kluyveromyces lactis (strain ATCC 8585 / CBS 2359 / DSM 70799 / NBRC 1267 / NRRL Y-1140 / WM37) TaxID=284590 RepID=Q6CUI8_KLULA|nr:uncharacterized protein KLLA0_C04532g [Kluyveromyces lactis]CAH01252.1 KLLA0C04532p [Kluyveromyces lactis]|eukprot:XP_452401.1 uncharacterized protein KLLA0_C04532g [Kluyveromyces lactis]